DEDGLRAAELAARERDDLGAVESEDADAEVAPARRQRGVGTGDIGGRDYKHVTHSTDTVPLVCQPRVSCPGASSSGACAVAAEAVELTIARPRSARAASQRPQRRRRA